MHPLLIAVPAAAGLYLLMRKKPGFVPSPATAAAPTPAAFAASVSPQQSAVDQAVVDEAFATFAQEREFPIEEQTIDTGISPQGGGGGGGSPVTTVDATTGQPGQDFFVDPGSGLRAQNAPPPEEEVEEESVLASFADAAADPFGSIFGSDDEE